MTQQKEERGLDQSGQTQPGLDYARGRLLHVPHTVYVFAAPASPVRPVTPVSRWLLQASVN